LRELQDGAGGHAFESADEAVEAFNDGAEQKMGVVAFDGGGATNGVGIPLAIRADI
jgi:hypothetical protein